MFSISMTSSLLKDNQIEEGVVVSTITESFRTSGHTN
jgi:hypothetical protein